VIHPSSVAVSREHRRAKNRQARHRDAEAGVLGVAPWERGHCSMSRVPTIAEEDAKRPERERECLVGERTRIINRMKATLARLGIRNFKPTLRKAAERLCNATHPGEHAAAANVSAELQAIWPPYRAAARPRTFGGSGVLSGVRRVSVARRSAALRNVGLKLRMPSRARVAFIRLIMRVRSPTRHSRSRFGRLASSSAIVGTRDMLQWPRSPRSHPKNPRFSISVSSRSVFARRCSRDTATLEGWITCASTPTSTQPTCQPQRHRDQLRRQAQSA